RQEGMEVLARFVELCGGVSSTISVLTAASTKSDDVWKMYDQAFTALGVQKHTHLPVIDREEANDPAMVAQLLDADGVFISGGDQKRLMAVVGGTALGTALRRAFEEGACIGGTSAGASAMSQHMLAAG